MVPMQVGDEDLSDLTRLDAALLNLYLRSLSTVKYPDFSIVCMEAVFTQEKDGWDISLPSCSAVHDTPLAGVG